MSTRIDGFKIGFVEKSASHLETGVTPHLVPPFKNAKEYAEYVLSLHRDPSLSNIERNALIADLEAPRVPKNRYAGVLPYLTGGLSAAIVNSLLRTATLPLPIKLAILAGTYGVGHEAGKRVPEWLAPGYRLESLRGDLSEEF